MSHSLPIALFSWFGYDLPLAERLGLIASTGFKSTAIWWGSPEKEFIHGDRHAMPAMVREAGLEILNAHVPFEEANRLWSDDATQRDEFVSDHLHWLDDLARHDIKCMVLHVAFARDTLEPSLAGFESFRTIVAAAEERQIKLAVENVILPQHLDFVLSEINSPALGFCYDSSHDFIYSDQPLEILSKWSGRLLQTHLSDNNGKRDYHWHVGDGSIDWPSLARLFPRETYKGALMGEIICRDKAHTEPPEEFLSKTFARLTWLAKLIDSVD